MVVNYMYNLPPLIVLDKYTHPNIFIAKHNGDDKSHDWAAANPVMHHRNPEHLNPLDILCTC